jgi:LAS superfamily LD-carboxypeptidase LdcB
MAKKSLKKGWLNKYVSGTTNVQPTLKFNTMPVGTANIGTAADNTSVVMNTPRGTVVTGKANAPKIKTYPHSWKQVATDLAAPAAVAATVVAPEIVAPIAALGEMAAPYVAPIVAAMEAPIVGGAPAWLTVNNALTASMIPAGAEALSFLPADVQSGNLSGFAEHAGEAALDLLPLASASVPFIRNAKVATNTAQEASIAAPESRFLDDKVQPYITELIGTLKEGRGEAIQKGNEFLTEWVKHPTTQKKLDDIITAVANDKTNHLNYLTQNGATSNNINGWTNYYDRVLTDLDKAKSYTGDVQEYPLSQQTLEFLGIGKYKDPVHSTNSGVSYGHVREEIPGDPRAGKAFVSRNPLMANAERESTTVHEGTHQWVKAYPFTYGSPESLKYPIQSNLSNDAIDAYNEWSSLANSGKSTEEIKKIMGEDRAYLGYLSDPTEVHARVMELRHAYGLKPDQVITPEMVQEMKNNAFQALTKSTKSQNTTSILPKPKHNSVDPKFFNIFDNLHDNSSLAYLFNKLPALIPAAAVPAAAAVVNNQAPAEQKEQKYGGWLTKYQDGGWQPNQEDLRADGTQKGTGYLGVLNRPDGGVSSELSMGVEIDGKEVQIPTMVPTLNPEEINYLLNIPTDEDLMRTEIGKRIMDKAYNHAMMRMDQGLSPFYQEGEERQDTGVPRKQNIFNTKYKRGGTTWLNEYANGGFNLTSPEYAEYEYLQSLNQPVTVVRQPAVGQYQMAQQVNDPSYSNRAYSNKTAVQSAKNAIEAAMPKQMTIDFSQAAVIEEPKEIIVKPTTTSTISTDESQANKVSDKLMSAFQKSTDEYKQKYPNRPSPVISSGFRSREKQEQLYANKGNNPYPVAKPGTSKHEHGLAIDVGFTGAHTDQDYANFAAIMNKNGVNWLGARDKVHFELNESAYGGWLDQYAQGGKTFSAGGEKHKVYRKESPTGNGEGVKGHIMVTHPTMDKGKWDTIDLTEKSGARTVAEGIAATRKWHEENPEYANGGGVNLNSPEYAEYQYLQSLNTPTPVYRQPAVETVQIPNTQLQYNTPYNYQRTVDTSYAKDAIEKAMPKQIEIDFGAAAEPVITPSEQKATKQKSESVASTGNLSMEEGTRRAYSAIVRELENDPATKDRAKDIAKMVMAQAAFETGNWRNAAALQANNYSGIKFYGQKGKKPSEVLAPGEEENGYRRPYVQYDSPEDWASGMVELLKGRYKKALETTTPEEYAARLKERGYYGGKESDYAKGLRYYLNNLKFEDKAEHGGWLTKYK